jgi:hypothetical protein
MEILHLKISRHQLSILWSQIFAYWLRQLSNFTVVWYREQVNFQWDDDEIRFVPNQHTSSLKQQSADRPVTAFGCIDQTVFLSFSIMLRAERKSNKYQSYTLWFNPMGACTSIYHTRGEHSHHSTTDAVTSLCLVYWWCLTPLSKDISVILWRSVLFVEETGENHRSVASHWQTLSHTVVHLALIEIRTHNISGDRHWLHS